MPVAVPGVPGIVLGVPALLVTRDPGREGSSKASSTRATLPWCVRTPASTCQISGQRAVTNSVECEMMQTAPPHSLIATARPPRASRSKKLVGSSRKRHWGLKEGE